MARKRATLTDLLNDLTFKTLHDKYKLIAMTAFKWENLPDGIKERHIERELFDHGFTSFFKHPKMSYMSLKCSENGRQNVYGDALGYNAEGFNFRLELDADDCVIIENNMLRIPTRDFIYFYVNKLTEAERTMDVNVKANKTPVIIISDEKDVLSFKEIFKKVDGNAPAIFADRSLNMDNVFALDLKTKFLGKELMDYKKTVENEVLTFLGINNVPEEKRERLLTDEVNSNNQLIDSFFNLQLEARQRACNEINAKYGLNISVNRRLDIHIDDGGNVDNDEGGEVDDV